MGSWAQAKLSCGQEGGVGQVWGMDPGREHRHHLGGVWAQPWEDRDPPTSGGQSGGGGCPLQEDFLLVSTMDSEVMRSLSLEVSKQGLA